MIYKSFKDLKLSTLGLGCMRLPTVNNDCNNIDEQKTAEMVDYAIKNGINYEYIFDRIDSYCKCFDDSCSVGSESKEWHGI